ncbi:C-type lectin domain family 1 member A isoform 2-T2 [Dugong dugon]
MHTKYSSTRDMLGDDGDAALSLHSLASTTTRRPGPEHTEHQAPSSAWRPAALTLVTLCLVLLTGLAALGLLFFQFYRLSITQQDSISQKEERLGNLSQQLQSLQAQNRKLAETLQLMAEKLCRELYNKTGGLSRNGSVKAWLWMDGTHYSSELFDIVIDFTCLRSKDCVTILNGKAFSKDCNELRRCACERTAAVVRTEWLYYHP